MKVILNIILVLAFSIAEIKSQIYPDWLIEIPKEKATVKILEGRVVMQNAFIQRSILTSPNAATMEYRHRQTGESFLRALRPEANVTINGTSYAIGGLQGQPVENFFLEKWMANLKPYSNAFQFEQVEVHAIKPRLNWKKRPEWMSVDQPWPSPGKEVVFTYKHPKLEVVVQVHYEIYDHMPVLSKWISILNRNDGAINIQSFTSEILACVEAESVVDDKINWEYPNMTIETDYNFGGMSSDNILFTSVDWKIDSLYQTQVNYRLQTPVTLEVAPKYGPNIQLDEGEEFTSYRVWELLHDSRDQDRKDLEKRRMLRAVAPWVTENPIMMHVRSAETEAVKKAIDQCAEVGFEMVIMTFGSGFNAEDDSPENIKRIKGLVDYAHSKGIALGGYSLLASRKVGGGNDVVMPEGKTPRFGNSPCLESHWGKQYFDKLYKIYRETGMDILEHDGSYPGDICASTEHPGHEGLDDSQWQQYQVIQEFYEWCRSEGIYLNVPDYYFLAGSNKTGMGYRETNWSLPREFQEIIERQNVYDGTRYKTPSMGWMFVPLVEYHGGGEAATIEPLKDHLPHYEKRLANLFGAGVQATWRGPQLYDAPATKQVVKKWVDFYKKHRAILDGDIIHLRRPDGRDWDGFLHVNPWGKEKGLVMLYNPLNESVQRSIQIPVYYTGIKNNIKVEWPDGKIEFMEKNEKGRIELEVNIPADGNIFVLLEEE
ncbi:MAG: alpha-galactosidase [Saprospiraceae bacterium]